MARIVDRAFDDPASAGGLFVVTLTAAAIVGNALFLQPGERARPLFGDARGVVEAPLPANDRQDLTDMISGTVPVPRSRDGDAVVTTASVPPPAATSAPPRASTLPPVTAEPVENPIVEIQRGLARLGMYSGEIDGLVGPRTRAAIAQYQATTGIAVTGEPSDELLDLIRGPAPLVAVQAPPPPVDSGARVDLAALESRTAELEQAAAAVAARGRTADVQAALNKIGYGPLTVDGRSGPDTENAIRQFELDNGLDVTGGLSSPLLDRLVDIGALDSTT